MAGSVDGNNPIAVIDDNPMGVRQWIVIVLMILLNALDGFDVLSSAFASPGISKEWGIPRSELGIMLSAELIGMGFGSLLLGGLADKIGRKPLLVFFGVAGAVLTAPILKTLSHTTSPFMAFLLISGAWIFTACYTSINAVVKAELFPTNIRATGVAVPYAVTVSIFGGTAPAIALWFKQQGHETWFYYYLSGIIFVSLLVYMTMRDQLGTLFEDEQFADLFPPQGDQRPPGGWLWSP